MHTKAQWNWFLNKYLSVIHVQNIHHAFGAPAVTDLKPFSRPQSDSQLSFMPLIQKLDF